MGILISADHDSGKGRTGRTASCALYLSLFPNIAKETGLDPELVARTRAAFEDGGVEAAAAGAPPSSSTCSAPRGRRRSARSGSTSTGLPVLRSR